MPLPFSIGGAGMPGGAGPMGMPVPDFVNNNSALDMIQKMRSMIPGQGGNQQRGGPLGGVLGTGAPAPSGGGGASGGVNPWDPKTNYNTDDGTNGWQVNMPPAATPALTPPTGGIGLTKGPLGGGDDPMGNVATGSPTALPRRVMDWGPQRQSMFNANQGGNPPPDEPTNSPGSAIGSGADRNPFSGLMAFLGRNRGAGPGGTPTSPMGGIMSMLQGGQGVPNSPMANIMKMFGGGMNGGIVPPS